MAGTNSWIYALPGIFLFFILMLRLCAKQAKLREIERSQVLRNSTQQATTRSVQTRETSISTETLIAQRIRDRGDGNRDRIYSIPIQLEERNTWTMITYPNSFLEGENRHTFTRINPLFSQEANNIPRSTVNSNMESSTENNKSEEPPPSYNSLFRDE